MDVRNLRADGLLLLTALIWGFAFVAQRLGMEFVGPFTFNGIRFALGCLVLLPLVLRPRPGLDDPAASDAPRRAQGLLAGGTLAGAILFAGASLQQVGLVYTTAGKAGFITGLYVVIVPLLGVFLGHRSGIGSWLGALAAAAGLYLLSVTEAFTLAFGDLLELVGAFFWAGHVLLVGWLSPRTDAPRLAFVQFAACSVLSLGVAGLTETLHLASIFHAAVPLVYSGTFSVGIAYTLQVVAQRHAPPAHAAILMSFESVFAAVGGWMILDETLTTRGLFGCALMLAGMLLSQLWNVRPRRSRAVALGE